MGHNKFNQNLFTKGVQGVHIESFHAKLPSRIENVFITCFIYLFILMLQVRITFYFHTMNHGWNSIEGKLENALNMPVAVSLSKTKYLVECPWSCSY